MSTEQRRSENLIQHRTICSDFQASFVIHHKTSSETLLKSKKMTLHFNMATPEWLISKVFNNQSTAYSTNHMISPHYVACQNDAPKINYLL